MPVTGNNSVHMIKMFLVTVKEFVTAKIYCHKKEIPVNKNENQTGQHRNITLL